LIAGVTEELDL
jgi:hypothetical protein